MALQRIFEAAMHNSETNGKKTLYGQNGANIILF